VHFRWLTKLFSAPPSTDPAPIPKVGFVDLPERSDGSTNYLTGAMRNDSLLDGIIGTTPTFQGGGWKNPLLGYGIRSRDKTIAGHFGEPIRLADPEISALFNGNDIAKRIICAKANEMFRRGWVFCLPGEAAAKMAPDGAKGSKNQGGVAQQTKPGASANDMTVKPDAAGQLSGIDKVRSDAVDPNADVQAYSKKQPLAGLGHEPATESGPAAPSPEAIPGADPKAAKPGEPAPGDQNSNADIAKSVEEYAATLQTYSRFQEATIFGRAYGGGLIIIGADDGQDMSLPLDEANIKGVKYLTFIDRRFIVAHSYYDMIGPKYGEVEVYNIINPFGNQANSYVHESRCIRFDGAPVDLLMRRRLAGWTLSVLQAPYDTMRQFDTSFQSIAQLMSDVSQAVMKIKGLAQLISNDQKTLNTRMRMVDMSRSSGRLVYLDAENEEFKREATPMNGIADVLEMQMLRLAAAAEMPVAILFGREPSGLNATGDADFRRFYDMIAGDQKQVLEPKLMRLYTLICLAKDSPTGGKIPDGGLSFTWHKLYEPSEKEQAEIRWLMAQADEKYCQNQILLPEEVAMSRFRSGDLHLDTEIQGDLRREKLATAELPPSGAEKAKQDQQNKTDEMKIKATALAAKPGAGGPPKPGARADSEDYREDGTTIENIIESIEDDYPANVMEWVKAARWTGPEKVKLKDIDMTGRAKWRASKDDLSGYIKRAKKGPVKPILLVETPDNDKYEVVDGHHRLLAAEANGTPVLAYCAKVFHDEGPWDTMHEAQHSGSSKSDPPSPKK
jgi:uncharacterized protein